MYKYESVWGTVSSSLLQFFSLIRNLSWLWFSCSFRLFLLNLNPNRSFVFNRIVYTRINIRQIDVIAHTLFARMHVHRCCSDRALKDKRDTLKVSQCTIRQSAKVPQCQEWLICGVLFTLLESSRSRSIYCIPQSIGHHLSGTILNTIPSTLNPAITQSIASTHCIPQAIGHHPAGVDLMGDSVSTW